MGDRLVRCVVERLPNLPPCPVLCKNLRGCFRRNWYVLRLRVVGISNPHVFLVLFRVG